MRIINVAPIIEGLKNRYYMLGRIANMDIITQQVATIDVAKLLTILSELSIKVEQLEQEVRSNKEKRYYTQQEAMNYLRISSPNTFRKYVRSGQIKMHGSNGERMQLFVKEDLDNFVISYK